MSKRRSPGEIVKRKAGSGFVGSEEPSLVKVPEGRAYEFDVVVGPDGNPRTVSEIHNGIDDIYEICPHRGTPFIVNKHHILTSSHPSPLSANRGGWWGNKHFEKCNQILESKGKDKINWKFY